jgi:hypothetical protein
MSTDDIALEGGHWVSNGRGVMEWVQTSTPTRRTRQKPTEVNGICEVCGDAFVARSSLRRTCGDACSKVRRARRKEEAA